MFIMSVIDTVRKLIKKYPMIKEVYTYGEYAFFYNPDGKPRGRYFCTVKKENLFNWPMNKERFINFYGKLPKGPHEFNDRRRPHEHYAWMQWMTLENPSEKEIEKCLIEAFERIK